LQKNKPLGQIARGLLLATTTNKIYKIVFDSDLADAIRLRNAAEALGMAKYVEHVIARFKYYFSKNTLSPKELTIIYSLTSNQNDMFASIVLGRIAYLVRQGEINYTDAYFKMLETKCPKLAGAVHKMNGLWEQRKADAKEVAARREQARRSCEEAIKREKECAKLVAHKKRIQSQQDIAARGALIEKLQNEIHTLTREELALVNRLRDRRDPVIMRLM
jgi:hypothetical protein